jgi:methionyl-tRNA formyltransferase
MRVLFLGPADSPLIDYLASAGEDVHSTAEQLDIATPDAEFLVSYGYRHILRKDVLDRFPSRAINLHISYLPYNRGADPNLWSIVEGTPKGVTIHHLDEGIDTGDIIAQRRVEFSPDDTLRSSYAKLQAAMVDLFREQWPSIRSGTSARRKQDGAGTFHKTKDGERLRQLLTAGWDTPIESLQRAYRAAPWAR